MNARPPAAVREADNAADKLELVKVFYVHAWDRDDIYAGTRIGWSSG